MSVCPSCCRSGCSFRSGWRSASCRSGRSAPSCCSQRQGSELRLQQCVEGAGPCSVIVQFVALPPHDPPPGSSPLGYGSAVTVFGRPLFMDAMSPQQDSTGQQTRSASLTGDSNLPGLLESRKKMKSLAQRRQSAPSLVLSKALNKSRTLTRENCNPPVSPETCPLLQSFINSKRSFLMDGQVHLKTGLQTQERHIFLFTDILVIAKSKSPSQFKLKQQVRLCEMWTASCMEEVCEGSTSPERSFVVGWPTTNCVATFSSSEQKEKWLSSLLSRIAEEKENDHPKSLPLKIFAKDIENCAYSKTLTITNMESARDVIKMALQQFGVIGSEKDYQLWVISGKDDAPYPLIGHEHPFGIKMSHIRDVMPEAQGLKEGLFSLDLQGPDLMEKLPQEMRCQFVLKPSRLAVCPPLSDLSQKPFKRRRSVINWAFWRGPSPQLDTAMVSPTPSSPGRLFGLPLSAICENDNLPKPVLDMLCFLYQEGPFTKGIFRRSANAKSCRELKDKLNSEAEVHLDCESIFATASVFKDFLRNIPDSIFSTKLCDKWVAVLDQGNCEEKIRGIQRLMEQLPRANVLLLRYLFGVLHTIEQHSQTNQMTAFNLAVCIAPSMLWLPTPSSPEIESDFTKKVSVFVQFLIENCSKIFGEEITTLFGDLSARCGDSREDGSDICSFQLIDSSYDSLDNELNDETDSTLNDQAMKRAHDNRSRDSVLTLSDCDLDQSEVEGIPIQLPPRSKPVRISAGLNHKSASQEHSENESLCSNTSGYSSTTVSDALLVSRRHRRCSEPIIGLLATKLCQPSGCHESAGRKTSCDAVMSHEEEDYLKQLRSLRVEGQKLINRSLTLGIDVNKGGIMRQSEERKDLTNQLLPPPPLRLNICLRTSCSSLSSPGTSPSGSSMSSLDSAFSQLSDYSVFTPNETSSPLDCPFRLQRKQVELPPEFINSNPFSVMHLGTEVSSSSKQGIKGNAGCAGKDSLEWPPQRSHVTLHPGSWIKSGASTMKNWSLRKKEKASKQDDKLNSVKIPNCEPHPGTSDLEHHSFQEEKLLLESSMTTQRVNSLEKGESGTLSSYQGIVELSWPASCEVEAKDGKQMLHKRLIDQSIVDSNGNGVKEVEHIISCQSGGFKNSGTSLMDKRNSHIPKTVFYGQNISLCAQTSKRQPSNSCTMGETQTVNLNNQCSPEQVAIFNEGREQCVKDSRVTSMRVANIKRNKVLPSNTDTEYKTPTTGMEKAFCVSPKPASTADDYFFQPDIHKCLLKAKDKTKGVVQNNGEHLKNCSSDHTFDRFFAEESYV